MGFHTETKCWISCDICEAESPEITLIDKTAALEDGFVQLKIELIIKGSQRKEVWLCPQCYKTKFKVIRDLFPEKEPEPIVMPAPNIYIPPWNPPPYVPSQPFTWPPPTNPWTTNVFDDGHRVVSNLNFTTGKV